MSFEVIPAHDVPLAEQAEIFTQAFAGYVGGSFAMDAPGLARFVLAQGADLYYSRFVRAPDGLAGFGYINRTGNISRLAGMGVLPNARRAGIARALLLHLLDEARARGEQAMMLEVIKQNPAAHALYAREGFREIGRLFGWRRKADSRITRTISETLEEISLLQASQLPGTLDYPDLPWAVSRHAIVKVPVARAFRTGNAVAVIGDTEVSPVRVHALFSTALDKIDWEQLRNALASILQRFPDREFFTPAVFPAQFGDEVFQPLGFTREPLNQFLMRQDLQLMP